MNAFAPGDVVVIVPMLECAHGPATHAGWHDDRLIGAVRRVVGWKPAEDEWPGGWLIFTDGDFICDGCCRKIATPKSKIADRIKACKPIRQKEPA